MSSNVPQEVQKPRSALASPLLAGQAPKANFKAVAITEPDSTSPAIAGRAKDVDSDAEQHFNLDRPNTSKRHRLGLRPVRNRPSVEFLPRARTPADLLKFLPHQLHAGDHHPKRAEDVAASSAASSSSASHTANGTATDPLQSQKGRHLTYHDLLKWIQKEKAQRSASKALKKAVKKHRKQPQEPEEEENREPSTQNTSLSGSTLAPAVVDEGNAEGETSGASRRGSEATSEGSTALEMLQEMLEKNMNLFTHSYALSNRSTHSLRRSTSIRKLKRVATGPSSDTEWFDGDPSVPSCDVVLDNSKTMSAGGQAENFNDSRPDLHRSFSTRERDAWKTFKYEIVRLAHTLKIKGWRRISMDESEKITVERLSGALTNAVYVVTPPPRFSSEQVDEEKQQTGKSKPQKLLLRIYGAQVEHLIDRESELAILRRLARKRIGPRLLGTFTNGRFEEFFNARALTAEELCKADISRQIAKRMRELHDGIELLDSEVAAGPFVWQNIDQWMVRSERIVEWLDGAISRGDWRVGKAAKRGRVVGADFKLFKEALRRYRKWIEENYNGEAAVKSRLVFAHNDAQYGNILRLIQGNESPSRSPTSEHKKLIVIDFEYANANVPGLEFANHFTEWCYNYHDEENSHACTVSKYPTPDEQTNFFLAYISHRPSFPPAPGTPLHRLSTTSLSSLASSMPPTPLMHPSAPAVGMVSSLKLENRSAPSSASPPSNGPIHDFANEEDFYNEAVRREVERLRWETRAWRGINSAQWVMWGVVQAKIPGLPAFSEIPSPYLAAKENAKSMELVSVGEAVEEGAEAKGEELDATPRQSHLEDEREGEEDDENGFDYLAYAFERARFFWGDVLALGIMDESEVPESVREMARVLNY